MPGLTNIGSTNTTHEGDLPDPTPASDSASPVDANPDPEAWRNEVAERLARYRTRRKPRAPRYPSLLLPFDSSDNWSKPAALTSSLATTPAEATFPHLEMQDSVASSAVALFSPHLDEHQPTPPPLPEPELSASRETKIIEFPRSAAIPVIHTSPLADPIFDRPRIVEAPEVLPPPPALGGILIEPVQKPPDPHAGFESRLQSASIPRRLLAHLIDGLILMVAVSAFAAIFLRFNPVRGPLPLLAGTAVATAVLLWMAYQFLFVVYTGSTPGIRAARLQLARFDGLPVSRRVRRWRVLTSFLSALSAGLGYLWCFLDADSLCWHDRITKTHLQFTPAT